MGNGSSRIELTWTDNGVTHTDGLHLPFVSTEEARAALSGTNGGLTLFDLGVPHYQSSLCQKLTRESFVSHVSSFSKRQPLQGRWFPARALGSAAFSPSMFRIEQLDDVSMAVNANHPLACQAEASQTTPDQMVTVSIAPDRSLATSPASGTINIRDSVATWLNTGIGLQGTKAKLVGPEPHPRVDETNDEHFYTPVRLVQHIDSECRRRVTQTYGQLIPAGARVLDLMSSWVSHLPDELALARLSGLGMNREELAANERLSDCVVHNLNRDCILPYDDNSFDAVVCSVSVEYLVSPIAVFREVARVLSPGGVFVSTFSDRCFPTKTIEAWGQLHPLERLSLVASWYQAGGAFRDINTLSNQGMPIAPADVGQSARPWADPFFAVWRQCAK